jgi:hypothetical protein
MKEMIPGGYKGGYLNVSNFQNGDYISETGSLII